MGLRVKLNGLVPGVVAGHVALPAVDAHLGVYQGHDVLSRGEEKKDSRRIF